MLGICLTTCLLLLSAFSVESQRDPSLPISSDSFRQVLRAFISVPKGRKMDLSDTRMIYYRGSTKNYTSYRIGNIKALLSDPTFDLQKPTVVYIYGYVELASDDSIATIVQAYIKRGGFNILVLDWSNCGFGDYLNVLLNIEPVGIAAGKAMLKLIKGGLNVKGLHIVGHSMGVHVGAVMGRHLKAKGYTVPRITGLDAAYPGFYPPILTAPISSRDAKFVDIIHTDGGWYGAPATSGHVDFWPNDGTATQPGCLAGTIPLTVENFCSHWRSWRYWAESVDGGSFLARKCWDYDAFTRGRCNGTAYMGLDAAPTLRGNYYLRTAAKEPFALGERGAN